MADIQRAPVGRPPKLALEQLVAVAAEMIEAEGLAGLTMRRVAERCGVTTMALYRHVRTKDDLIALVANQAMGDFRIPEVIGDDWRDQVAAVARAQYHFLLDHPEFVSIFASRPINSVVAFRSIEAVLGALHRAGLDDEAAVSAHDVLVSFIRGFVQQHAGSRARASSPIQRLAVIGELPSGEFEHVIRVAGRLVMREGEQHFEEELAIVIAGIEARYRASTDAA
jgi:AcrR family transcriptional regulator